MNTYYYYYCVRRHRAFTRQACLIAQGKNEECGNSKGWLRLHHHAHDKLRMITIILLSVGHFRTTSGLTENDFEYPPSTRRNIPYQYSTPPPPAQTTEGRRVCTARKQHSTAQPIAEKKNSGLQYTSRSSSAVHHAIIGRSRAVSHRTTDSAVSLDNSQHSMA